MFADIRELFSQEVNGLVDGWIAFEGDHEVKPGRAVFIDELPGSVGCRFVVGTGDRHDFSAAVGGRE